LTCAAQHEIRHAIASSRWHRSGRVNSSEESEAVSSVDCNP
jgi:hypothetical protein